MKIPTPAEILAMRDLNDYRIVESVQERILHDIRTCMTQNTLTGSVGGPLTIRVMNRVRRDFEQAGWKFDYKFRNDDRNGDYYEYTISHNLSM